MADLLQIQSMIDISNVPVDQSALLYQTSTKNFQYTAIVRSFNGRTGVINLSSVDVTTALGFTPVNNDFVASGVGHAHGLVPDPGGVAGITKFLREDATWQIPAYPVTTVFGRVGDVVLSSGDVTAALGFTPLNKAGDTATGPITIQAGAAGNIPLKLQFAANPTANAMQVLGSNGTSVFFAIDSSGNIATIGGLSKRIQGVSSGVFFPDGLLANVIPSAASSNSVITLNWSATYPIVIQNLTTNNPGSVPLVIAGATAQTAHITEWWTHASDGTALAFISAGGGAYFKASVGINQTAPDASAILDVVSTTLGVLFPRMTTTQKNAIASPAAGLVLYDSTLAQISYYNGSTWQALSAGSSGTVTSVGLSLPAIFTVSGSPVTTTGTLTAVLASQVANLALLSPNGSSGVPTFRSLVIADLPTGIPNANLANFTVMITAGNGLSGGGTISLGGTGTLSLNQAFAPTWTAQHIFDYAPVTGVVGNWSVRFDQPPFAQATGAVIEIGNGKWDGTANSFSGNASANGGTYLAVNTVSTFVGNILDFQIAGSSKFSVSYQGNVTANSIVLPAQAANTLFAAPNGSSGVPLFRLLVAADIPVLAYVISVGLTVPSFLSVSGSPITTAGTLAVTLVTQNANLVFAGPVSGGAVAPTFRSLVVADLPTAIPNANLANASITVTAGIGLSGGGAVALGTSVTLSLNQGVAPTWTAQHIFNYIPITGTANNWSIRIAQIPFAQASGALLELGDGAWAGAANSFSGDASANGGTFVGINSLNSAFAGNYIDCQLAGISKFSVRYDGQITVAVVPVLPNQTTNKVFASPNGSTGTPAFRALVVADLPTGIPNANLANSSVTITAGVGLSGGGVVNLGTSVTVSLDLTRANTWTGKQTYSIAIVNTPVVLTDAATIAIDASLGNTFRCSSAVDRILGAPTNATDGQKIIVEWKNTDTNPHTLTLTAGAAGFAFGSDITAITATVAGKTDEIGAVYNSTDNRWRVVSYAKGF